VAEGGTAGIDIEMLDESYRPMAGEPISIAITWTAKDGAPSKASFTARVDKQGKYHKEWNPGAVGAHTVTVTGPEGLTGQQRFLVVTGEKEQSFLDIEPDFLKALAKVTRGSYTAQRLEASRVVTNAAKGREVLSQRVVALWDHPALLLLLFGLLAAEWLLRRRVGID
jgi:hypothetical protein